MSEKTRSFFATIPGVVTGLAGLLTAVVGLVTLLVQLEVIGGDDSEPVGTTGTTVAGSATTVAGGGSTPTTQVSFTVPSRLAFAPTDPKEKTVTIRNTGSGDLKVTGATVTGQDRGQFATNLGDCTGALRPNGICNLKVTFAPSGPLRSYTATLQVEAQGARSQQVDLTASTLL